jgi:hypothetical protein
MANKIPLVIESGRIRQAAAGDVLVFPSVANLALTSGRVTYATADGLLTDASTFTFDGNTLFTNKLAIPSTASATVGVIDHQSARFLHAYNPGSGGNVFLGREAGNFTMSPTVAGEASYNLGIGTASLVFLTTGYKNVGVGTSSLQSVTSGYSNIGIGHYAGVGITSGGQNTCIGDQTAFSITTGSQNVAIGAGALRSAMSKNANVAVGYIAAYSANSQFGTYLGVGAGYRCAGDNSVFVGYTSGFYETAGSTLMIDNVTRANEADGRVKALVYGIFASTAVAQDFVINGQVGVNITPTSWLTLRAGSTAAGTAPLKFTSGSLLTTAEACAVECLDDKLYFTITTGAARKEIALTEGLTSGRIPYATTNGRLTDSTNVRYDGTNVILSGLKYPNADGTNTQVLSTDGAGNLAWTDPAGASAATAVSNLLINGGFDFFQRSAPGTLTEVPDDYYGPDRWIVLTQTATVKGARTTGAAHSKSAGRLQQHQASAQRVGLLQIIESRDSIPTRGEDVTLQLQIKCTASQPIMVAILEWTGTADTVTSDVVLDWASETYTANNFFLAANLTVVGVEEFTPDADTWTSMSVSGTISASCNNLIVVGWSKGTMAQNVELIAAEAGLYQGTGTFEWKPRPVGDELALCQRYYEKSYNPDIPPATVTTDSMHAAFVSSDYMLCAPTVHYSSNKHKVS